ncbi:MAG: hypothetical protein ACLQCB_16980 [Spirochaetia bacterium]
MRLRAWRVAAVLLLLAASAFAQDFRKVTWGMSVDDVVSAESALTFSQMDEASNTTLTSHVNVMGHNGILNYIFENDKLVIAQYKFDDEDDMRTYTGILNILKEKYGAPSDSGDSFSHWKLPRTYIGISFKDDVCKVVYADQGWVADAKENRKAEYDSFF